MPQPISTAPKNGRKVQIQWRDRDGVENTSLGSYVSSADPSESGWWVSIDSDTKKRVQPHSWASPDSDEED